MREINVANVLIAQIEEAKHSGSPIREEVADKILRDSGVFHSVVTDGEAPSETDMDLPLESEDVQPVMEAAQQLANLAVNERLTEQPYENRL